MIRYEVYFDESGSFKNNNELCLVAGFACRCDTDKQTPVGANRYRDIMLDCLDKINVDLANAGIAGINPHEDRTPLHSTLSNSDTTVVSQQKNIMRAWLRSKDRKFAEILSAHSVTVTAVFGRTTSAEETLLEGFYRHMLHELMLRITAQLRARHPDEDVDILFAIPTRKAFAKDENECRAFAKIGLSSKVTTAGFDINLSQGFLMEQEEMGVRIVCRQISYWADRAKNDDHELDGNSWGYYLADWICSWVRSVTDSRRPVDLIRDILTLGQEPPVLIAYSREYREMQQMLRSGVQEPLRYLRLCDSLASREERELVWLRELMKREHPYRDSNLFARTVELINEEYNSASNPLYGEAVHYYDLLHQLVEADPKVSRDVYADLCEQLLRCSQYNGENLRARKIFEHCFRSRVNWSNEDLLSMVSLYSDTYINLLAEDEAEAMLSWALENSTSASRRAVGRWMELPAENDSAVLVRARAVEALALARAYRGDDASALFAEAVESLRALGRSAETNVVRFHWIQHLLEGDDHAQSGRQLNLYFTGRDEPGDLRSTKTWETWLETLFEQGRGEPDRLRFPLWLYQKALYMCWDMLIDDAKLDILIRLFDDADTVTAVDRVLEIPYHPVEELLVYRGLLATKAHPGIACSILEQLAGVAKEHRDDIIALIAHIGMVRIRIELGEIRPGTTEGDYYADQLKSIRQCVARLHSEWRSIRPEGSCTTRIDRIHELLGGADIPVDAGTVADLLSFEFR